MAKDKNIKTFNTEIIRHIIKTFTDHKVNDPIADRDTLESLIGYLIFDNSRDYINAQNYINSARQEAINENRNELIDWGYEKFCKEP
jgi:hypothetical protein